MLLFDTKIFLVGLFSEKYPEKAPLGKSTKSCKSGFPYCFLTDFMKFFF